MHFAEHLANGIGKRLDLSQAEKGAATWVQDYLDGQRELLALDAVEFYLDPTDERILSQKPTKIGARLAYPRLALDLLDRAFSGEHFPVIHHVGTGELIRCLVPVHAGGLSSQSVVGVIVVNFYVPVSLVNKVDEIAGVFDDYKEANPLKYPMKTTYLLILIMITLVILFVVIWVGLYMARELTVPVARLVEGAQAVGSGNLDVTILTSGHDEIAELVDSFNKMTRDLRENRESLIQAGADLEKRRLQLEAVLANISTGVVAIDHSGDITIFNQSVSKLLSISAEKALDRRYQDVFGSSVEMLIQVVQRALAASLQGAGVQPELTQWNYRSGEMMRVLAAVATPLRQGNQNWGVVIVIDDMTHLIKGQREMAWREVARRIAHEIKNPLTPIKLSAQRLQRRFLSYRGRDGEILKECTDTIIKHTDELKEMVNEFSNFARFPESSPAPNDLNLALREVVTLYQQAHPEIEMVYKAESRLPIFEFDRDQIKRVIINLFDNAVAALAGKPQNLAKKIEILTHYHDQLQMVAIEVIDNGLGMTDEVKARVFEPYFSTKTGGTGLGLAIVKRIINDHNGFIRVRSAPNEGTQFLIELPSAIRQGLEKMRGESPQS